MLDLSVSSSECRDNASHGAARRRQKENDEAHLDRGDADRSLGGNPYLAAYHYPDSTVVWPRVECERIARADEEVDDFAPNAVL